MSLRNKFRGLGIENFQEGGAASGAAQTEAQPEHETMSAQIVELNEAENEMDQTVAHQEEVEEAAVALESFLQKLYSFEEAGGMSPETAAVAADHVDHILEPVGITGEDVIPSVESFGSSTGRRTATRISVEGVKETLGKIWDYIKDLIAKIRKQLKDWWLKTFDAAPRLVKRAEALYQKADGLTSAAKKNEKVKVGGEAAKVAIGGKVPSAKEVLDSISGVAEKLYGGDYAKEAKRYVEAVSAAVGGLKFENDAAFDGSTAALKAVKPVNVPGLADKPIPESDKRFGKLGTGLTAKSSEVLPGNKLIVHIVGAESEELRAHIETALAKTQYQLVDADAPTTKASGDTEMEVLSIDEMKALSRGVADLGGMIQKYKAAYAESDKLKDDAVKAGDKASAESKKAKDLSTANTSIASAAIRVLQSATNVVDQPTQKFTSYVIATASAVLTLCDKSLAQYK